MGYCSPNPDNQNMSDFFDGVSLKCLLKITWHTDSLEDEKTGQFISKRLLTPDVNKEDFLHRGQINIPDF